MFKYGVVIGRFQPVHLGHLYMIRQALSRCHKVLIMIGSAYRAPTVKNPFCFDDRQQLIQACLQQIDASYLDRVKILPLEDQMYNESKWINTVRSIVSQYCQQPEQVALVAHDKDASTYYLAHFPEWQFVALDNYHDISATPVRDAWFVGELWQNRIWIEQLPQQTIAFLQSFEQTEEYQRLRREFDCIKRYQQEWSGTPYPSIFTTTDAIVVCDNHILLVRRKYPPGQYLLALPGGFLEANEWIQQGLLRELKEETSIELSDQLLMDSLATIRVFDHPGRSQIGRVITHAGYFDLKQQILPAVQAADDALEAIWYPLAEQTVLKEQMHDDHYYILAKMLSDSFESP